MSTIKPGDVTDWRIVLEPFKDPTWDSPCTLDILRGDEDDAVDMLELYVAKINHLGKVPPSMDWQNESFCSVTGRVGKLTFRVRCDSFERETDSGWTNGSGLLRAKRVLTDA